MSLQLDHAEDGLPSDRYNFRCEQCPWDRVVTDLNQHGAAVLRDFLSADECREMVDLFTDPSLSASPPIAELHAWGTGQHRYFKYPMSEPIADLRSALFPRLAVLANGWNERLGLKLQYPEAHGDYLRTCKQAGQTLSTSTLSVYLEGEFRKLHQDDYGELVFPLQVTIQLSQPGEDFAGGEFVLVEQRPRMQSRPEVVPLEKGDAVIFPVSHRPVAGSRGTYRANLRHGVSTVRAGRLCHLNIVFHDAAA